MVGRCLKGITSKCLASCDIHAKKSLNIMRVVAWTQLAVFLIQAKNFMALF